MPPPQATSEVWRKDCLLPFNRLLSCMHCTSLPWQWGTYSLFLERRAAVDWFYCL